MKLSLVRAIYTLFYLLEFSKMSIQGCSGFVNSPAHSIIVQLVAIIETMPMQPCILILENSRR